MLNVNNFAHLLEWSKSKTLTPLNAAKNVEQYEPSFIAGENGKWYSLVTLVVSQKTKLSNCTSQQLRSLLLTQMR